MKLFIKSSLVIVLLSIFSVCLAQPENFDIVIKRNSVVGNLVYGTIFLNGQEIGTAFENNDLKIPTGVYKGLMRYNSGSNFVQSELGNMSTKGDFLLEVSDVANNRTDILLHPGNLPKHSKGCILLGPVKKGPDGAVTIDSIHPLRKLRLDFYGTDAPISSPNKNISITVADDYISEYKGNAASSNGVNFGGGQNCTWSMKMENVTLSFTVNRQTNEITQGQLQNDAVESTVAGNCPPAGRRINSYSLSSGTLSGNKVIIDLTPSASNYQKCYASFIGTISDNNVSGTIKWKRYDQGATINYRVTMPISLTK